MALAMESRLDNEWYILLLHEDAEYHHLARVDLFDLLREAWAKEFNALFIGRDVDCLGRLGAFFRDESAYVAYEEFDTGRWLSSHNPSGAEGNGEEDVRLSPDNAEDYSFLRRLLITKTEAWAIVQEY